MEIENYRFEILKEFRSDDDMALPQKVFETNDEKEAIGFYLLTRDKDIHPDYYYEITDKTKLDGYYHGDNIEWRREINGLSQEEKNEYIEYYSKKHNEHEKQEKKVDEKLSEINIDSIKIVDFDFTDHPEFKDKFVKGAVITDKEEQKALWQVLGHLDDAIKQTNDKEQKFSKDNITLEVGDENHKLTINPKFGENYFKNNNLDKFVSLCCNDIARQNFSQETKQDFGKALERNQTSVEKVGQEQEETIYKNPATQNAMDQLINNSLNIGENLGKATGDESVEIFMKNLSKSYAGIAGIGQSKDDEKDTKQVAQSKNYETAEETLSKFMKSVGKKIAGIKFDFGTNKEKTLDKEIER